MLAAGEAKADQIGIPYNIAVVDAGGYLLAFSHQDGALIGSIDLAIPESIHRLHIRNFNGSPRRVGSTRKTVVRHPRQQRR